MHPYPTTDTIDQRSPARRRPLLRSALALIGLTAAGGLGLATGQPAQASPGSDANNQQAFSFFVDKGLTDKQSAGIVGNLDQESGMSPTAVQSGGPGRGIAQWSVDGRWQSLLDYAKSHGESAYSLGLQLNYLWHELTTVPAYGLADLKATATLSGAVIAFQDDFERCGSCATESRLSYANAVLRKFGGSSGTPTVPYWEIGRSGAVLDTGKTTHAYATTDNGLIFSVVGSGSKYDIVSRGELPGGHRALGSAAVTYNPDDEIYHLYAVATDHNLYENTFDDTWGGWKRITDTDDIATGAAAVVDKTGHQHVFVTTLSHNIRSYIDNGHNSDWTNRSVGNTGISTSDVPAVTYSPATDVYRIFANDHGRLVQNSHTPDHDWNTNWNHIGDTSTVTGGLAAVLDKTGQPHVFLINGDHTLYSATLADDGSWDVVNHGGTHLVGTPKATYDRDSGDYDIFAATDAGTFVHKRVIDNTWQADFHQIGDTSHIVD